MWQELLPFTALLSENISFAFNPTLSFIHASAGLCPPPSPSHQPLPVLHPPHSFPLFICILFLGQLISPLSFILVPFFFFSLYLPPSSCSSVCETILLRGRYASQGYNDNPVTPPQVNTWQGVGKRERASGGRVCSFNSLSSKFEWAGVNWANFRKSFLKHF